MNPIDDLDSHSMFFPIGRDNNPPRNSGGNDNAINDFTDNRPGFQGLLNSLKSAGNLADGSTRDGAVNSLTTEPGVNNKTEMLLSLLKQMSQPDFQSQDSNRAGNRQLNQFIAGPDTAENKPDNSNFRIISKYVQAMRDFRNAFNLPTDDLDRANVRVTKRISGGQSGINPDKQQVVTYISEQCQEIGIPVELGLATAATESDMTQFNRDGTPYRHSNSGSTDWGIMQINDKAWGDTYDFDLIKSDWKYNVRAGLRILKASLDAAVQNGEGSKGAGNYGQNLARAAYSGYNAGTRNLWRYRTPIGNAPQTGPYDVLNDDGYDIRDIRFWDNYQKLSK